MSGYAATDVAERLRDHDGCGFILKPAQPHELIDCLRTVIQENNDRVSDGTS